MQPRRITGLIVIAGLVTSGLTVRLFTVSVLQHEQYLATARDQQTVQRTVLPRRGDIYVRDLSSNKSLIIAKSVERFALSAVPQNVVHKKEYAAVLAKASGRNEADILKALEGGKAYMPPLRHGLTQDEVEQFAKDINVVERQINASWEDIEVDFGNNQGDTIYFAGGIIFLKEFQRVYPEGSLLGQALGFVNDEGVGKYGLEGEYDNELKGYLGRISLEQDSVGTLLSQTQAVAGKDGANYELSIDRNIQFEVEQELAQSIKDSESQGGSVIIMDPKTGEILAMANQPSYDPNGVRDLTQEQVGLFDNPSISKVWEPGSIFKPLVMSAALDLNLVTPETKETFPASVTVDGHKIETALRKAYGEETMTQVLANSDNVAMVSVADKIGNQKMYEYLTKYGFGDFTGVDLKNEISGAILPVKKWRNINRATISFGQGIAVTPMQIVAAYAAIANDGKRVQPRMVHAIYDDAGRGKPIPTKVGEQVISPENAKKLRDMMVATVEFSHKRAGTPGYKIGGKTGTAQIPDPEKGGYLEEAYNHSFVGIGPSDDPRYVMLVKLDHPNIKKVGIYAEGTAVPLFGKISTFLLNYFQIPPTNR